MVAPGGPSVGWGQSREDKLISPEFTENMLVGEQVVVRVVLIIANRKIVRDACLTLFDAATLFQSLRYLPQRTLLRVERRSGVLLLWVLKFHAMQTTIFISVLYLLRCTTTSKTQYEQQQR